MKTFLALTGLSLSLTCGSHAAGLEISPFASSADPLVHICTFNQSLSVTPKVDVTRLNDDLLPLTIAFAKKKYIAKALVTQTYKSISKSAIGIYSTTTQTVESVDIVDETGTVRDVGIETFTMGTRLRLLAAGCR